MARTFGGQRLGTFYQTITLTGPNGRALSFEGLVDTGAHFSVVPASTLRELGVRPIGRIRCASLMAKPKSGNGQVDAELIAMHRPVPVFFDDGAPVLIGAHTVEAFLLENDVGEQRLVPKEPLLM
jgi:predicted aspartyl protease